MAASAKVSVTYNLWEIQKKMRNSKENALVWKNLLNWNQTLGEWSLGGSISELYLMTPTANQDGCHSRTKFNIAIWEIH